MSAWGSPPEPDWEGPMEVRCDQVFTTTRTNVLGFEEDIDVECDWEGKADVVIGQGRIWFDCPKCGRENEQNADKYDDSDDYYEMLAEERRQERRHGIG